MKIFVSLGNANFSFIRLLNLLSQCPVDFNVTVQYGYSSIPDLLLGMKNIKFVDFITESEFKSQIIESDIVIGHAGIGFISICLQFGKMPFVLPRRSEYDEHINDHQCEFVDLYKNDGIFKLLGSNLPDLSCKDIIPPSRGYINNILPVISFLNNVYFN